MGWYGRWEGETREEVGVAVCASFAILKGVRVRLTLHFPASAGSGGCALRFRQFGSRVFLWSVYMQKEVMMQGADAADHAISFHSKRGRL